MTSRRLDGSIGPDFVVHGRLDGKSDLRIDGIFEGQINIDGAIVVGPEGSVQGDIVVHSLDVAGRLRGDVKASASVTIRSGGRLHGDVTARQVAIDDGGVLQGGIEMEFELPDEPTGGER